MTFMKFTMQHISVLVILISGGALAIELHNPTYYRVGVGISDVTGPAAEQGMMGYGDLRHKTSGIHTRLFSRAFIFEEGDQAIVYVLVDTCMVGQLVKKRVIRALQRLYGDRYRFDNVMITATHTHSAPGGFLQYATFSLTSGFSEESVGAQVKGIVRSIRAAHKKIRPARVYFSEDRLSGAAINRSPKSYDENPKEERDSFGSSTDETVHQLHVVSHPANEIMGMINWFAVHATSMNVTNKLISGDSKGLAGMTLEKMMNTGYLVGKGPFVAAFATANHGDTSPNILGSRCIDTGVPCDHLTTTCGGANWKCHAVGPGKNQFHSTEIIAGKQWRKAKEMLDNPGLHVEVKGGLSVAHQWLDMSRQKVPLKNGRVGRTCPPALGYAFAAGTSDGPGFRTFRQGTNETDPYWAEVVIRMAKMGPSPRQEACHAPKPILINAGELTFPFQWQPTRVDTQMFRLGHVLIAGLPGEFTTMAGRRMRRSISEAANNIKTDPDTKVVLAGMANAYTHYITTFEEYQVQRYEGGAVLYGPHTLAAYQRQYRRLTERLLKSNSAREYTEMGVPPPDLSGVQLPQVPTVIFDAPKVGYQFGDCTHQPSRKVLAGQSVIARFVSAHPRNDLMLGGTFLSIERRVEHSGSNVTNNNHHWEVIYTDADWETMFTWTRVGVAASEGKITWDVPKTEVPGLYRIGHFGHYKPITSEGPRAFKGQSREFSVLPNTPQSQNEIRRSSSDARRKRKLGRKNIFSELLSKVTSLFGRK